MDPNLAIAIQHVRRSMELVEAQADRVREFERRGWDSKTAETLLLVMVHALRLMVEHRDRLASEERFPTPLVSQDRFLQSSASDDDLPWPLAAHNNLPWPLAPEHLCRRPRSASRASASA